MSHLNRRLKTVLTRAITDAGKLLRRSIHRIRRIDVKSDDGLSLVTEVDKRSEAQIIRAIKKSFPDHAILAEESAPQGQSPYKWIIDPIDGTTNYAHTFPAACVSIACEKDGRIELGGVLDPFRREFFFAERGRGAFLNGKPIRTSKVKSLSESLLVTGFPYDRKIHASYYLKIYGAFMTRCHGIRRTGSAALDLCYIASGRFDGFWEMKLSPWDTAAASLIVLEAGGRLSDFKGGPYSVYDPQILATNGRIHREMLAILRPFLRKKT
ncbi:MAG TPA: inositol monophosphatase family protein [Candidatus Omnitrophota bacterium]|nr:inositol monophosphatase family protein [Candidatus Omnitrophota bacterium]